MMLGRQRFKVRRYMLDDDANKTDLQITDWHLVADGLIKIPLRIELDEVVRVGGYQLEMEEKPASKS